MAFLIDTDVAIRLRDREPGILQLLAELEARPILSVISRVELEGGVYSKPPLAANRRRAVDALLEMLTVIPFDTVAADAYRRIVEAIGHSRRKVGDRMIAATAIVHDLTLITMNGRDFSDIPGLSLMVWPNPAN